MTFFLVVFLPLLPTFILLPINLYKLWPYIRGDNLGQVFPRPTLTEEHLANDFPIEEYVQDGGMLQPPDRSSILVHRGSLAIGALQSEGLMRGPPALTATVEVDDLVEDENEPPRMRGPPRIDR